MKFETFRIKISEFRFLEHQVFTIFSILKTTSSFAVEVVATVTCEKGYSKSDNQSNKVSKRPNKHLRSSHKQFAFKTTNSHFKHFYVFILLTLLRVLASSQSPHQSAFQIQIENGRLKYCTAFSMSWLYGTRMGPLATFDGARQREN